MDQEKLELVQSMIDATARKEIKWEHQEIVPSETSKAFKTEHNGDVYVFWTDDDLLPGMRLRRIGSPATSEEVLPFERLEHDKMSSLYLAIHESLGLK